MNRERSNPLTSSKVIAIQVRESQDSEMLQFDASSKDSQYTSKRNEHTFGDTMLRTPSPDSNNITPTMTDLLTPQKTEKP